MTIKMFVIYNAQQHAASVRTEPQGTRITSLECDTIVGRKTPIMTSFSKPQNKKCRWTEQSRAHVPIYVHQGFPHLCWLFLPAGSLNAGAPQGSPHLIPHSLLRDLILSHGFNYSLLTLKCWSTLSTDPPPDTDRQMQLPTWQNHLDILKAPV